MQRARFMRRSVLAAFLPFVFIGLAVSLCLLAGAVQPAAADESTAAQASAAGDYRGTDGVYQVQAKIRHATQDQDSMAVKGFDNVLKHGAVKADASTRLLTLVVKDGKTYLLSRLIPITQSLGATSFKGYLGYLDYYPSYHGSTSPSSQTPTAALVDSYYTATDGYNKAKTGSDAALRGQKYPENVSMQINANYSTVWLRVYVPVMESINAGSGTQFAKIELDYSTMQPVTDESQVKTAETMAEHHAAAVENGYQDLANEITSASRLLLETNTYTKASLSALRTARNTSQTIYAQRNASQFTVMKSLVDLALAQSKLEKKAASSSGTSSSSSSKSANSSSSSKLNFAKLKDGTYTVYGEMIKTDRNAQSMSNAAIDHNIRIKVKNGKYTVQMTFTTLHYSGKTGALGKLWYFKTGYGHANGTLTGSTARAKTLSYLTASDGSRYSDEYGTNYPKTVSFPLITEAKSDGWVPLQVFVPVMDSISKGTGTQGVYLRLHTSTVVSGVKNVSDTSTGTSSSDSSSGSSDSAGSDDGESAGALPSGDDDSSVASSDDSDSSESNDEEAAAAGTTDGSDSGDNGSDSGDASQTSDNSDQAEASEPEPPMKRYLGLMGGGGATAVFAGLGYALIRRRALIAALIGAAH